MILALFLIVFRFIRLIIIHFLNNRETVSEREYTVGDVIIKKVTAEKDLGVTVDKDFLFPYWLNLDYLYL